MTIQHLAVFITLLAACSPDDDAGTNAGGGAAGGAGDGVFVPDGCEEEAVLDVYSEGLSRDGDGGLVKVTLSIATPGPPDKGENRWTVRVEDAGGQAIADATVFVRPFMEVHGHTSNPAQFAGDAQGDGSYLVGPFILGMAGRWDITIDVTLPDGGTDAVVFRFCAWG